MSDLTNGEKISIMDLAHRVVRDDEAIKDQPKGKHVVRLYDAMIKAIIGSQEGNGSLADQIVIFGQACENLGQVLHLPLSDPKRSKAVQRVDLLTENINRILAQSGNERPFPV